DRTDHMAWYRQSALLLELRDVDGYRRVCHEMLMRFGQTENSNVAERTAKTCLLMPGAIRDLKSVLKLADQAVTGTQKHGDYRWFLLARGMADYRADQYADAIDRMKKVLLPGAEDLYRDPMADLFLAMAHHQRGQADESRKALDKARALMAQRF